jgi:hypothetical protein
MKLKERTLGQYSHGDHVKIDVFEEQSGTHEWMWLLVDWSEDAQPVINTDMHLGQELAISYDNVREHRKFE